MPSDYQWISSDSQLAEAAVVWAEHSVLGIDTEFIRTRTFYPIAALYQLAAGDHIFLIDPLQVEDWSPLRAVLTDPQRRLLMHACSEDMEVFAWHLKATPTAVFDTQVAAAFLGPQYSVSYSALVDDWLSVTIDKDQTRSDWLQRPLTPAQLNYATADVRYLAPLYQAMREKLETYGRWEWFLEECATLTEPKWPDPDTYYRNVRRAHHFSPRELARLRLLCTWRERRTRELDRPRSRLVPDDVLVEVSAVGHWTRNTLYERLKSARIRVPIGALADEILALLAEADALPESALPEPLTAPLTQSEARLYKRLRQLAVDKSEALGLAPELLGRRRDLEACLRHFQATGRLSDAYLGWRYPVIGAALEDMLSAFARQAGWPLAGQAQDQQTRTE